MNLFKKSKIQILKAKKFCFLHCEIKLIALISNFNFYIENVNKVFKK